jgi:RNase H-like domain found in reverse transcriptase
LTGKHAKFVWDSSCQKAFDELKALLISPPILVTPAYGAPYILDVDASDIGLGAVISQLQDGEERVIAYSSRTLTPAEKNYCATRKELLSLVYHLKKFKYYLLGGPQFRVRTDHGALTWLRSSPEPIGQNARWCEILQEYDFSIEHRSGLRHQNCDALS